MIWLPYGQTLVSHLKKENKKITLLVNHQLIELAEDNFPECQIIGINTSNFLRNFKYRFRTLRQIRELGAEKTYHDVDPRDALIGDALVRALGSPALGFEAVFHDRVWLDRVLHAQYYEQLVPRLDNAHQSERHAAFLHMSGISENTIVKSVKRNITKPPISASYAIISPGAGQAYRRWPTERFIALVEKIHAYRPRWKFVVIGTDQEIEIANQIVSALGEYSVSLAGKTTVKEMLTYIAHAKLLLGNDSAAPHIAAAIGIPSIALIGGGHFGRCLPYPTTINHIKNHPVAIANYMDCFGCDWACRYRVSPDETMPCIDGITVELAWSITKGTLESLDDKE